MRRIIFATIAATLLVGCAALEDPETRAKIEIGLRTANALGFDPLQLNPALVRNLGLGCILAVDTAILAGVDVDPDIANACGLTDLLGKAAPPVVEPEPAS